MTNTNGYHSCLRLSDLLVDPSPATRRAPEGSEMIAAIDFDAAPLVQVAGLRKSFGSHEVLKGIDLSVRRGEIVAMIGPSGSGKSTLLRCVNQLETHTAGTVTVAGADHRPRQRLA